MTRRTGSFPALIRIALVAGVIYWLLPDKVASVLVHREVPAEVTMTRASTIYVLGRDDWTVFQVPLGQSQLKIVCNATVPSGSQLLHDLECEFGVQLEIVDGSGAVLRRQSLAQRAGILTYRDSSTGEVFPAQAYLGEPLLPLASRTMIVNLEGLDDAPLRVRMQQGSCDPRVADVAVRVYVQGRPAQYKLRYLWQRFSLTKRERLARANVHALELLSDTEKRNLLENRSVALAPAGVKGRDYRERKLYSLRDRLGTEVAGSILPRGLYIAPDMLGSVPLPADITCLRLELQLLEAQERGGVMGLTFYEREAFEPRVVLVELETLVQTVEVECSGGLLEIEASVPLVARAFLGDRVAAIEISPEAERLPAYVLHPDAPVRYGVAARDKAPGAFRLDLRRLIDPELEPVLKAAILRYELRDESGVLLRSGLLSHNMPVSRHDRVRGAIRGVQVTEPSRHYLRLPPRCVELLLYSFGRGVCVTAATRPADLPRIVRVPEDYQAYERGQDEARNWFPVRPINRVELLPTQREVFVRVQARPASAESPLDAGYDAHSCIAENAREVFKLMSSVPLTAIASRPPGPTRFTRLLPGKPSIVELALEPGVDWIQPRLICLKGTSRPASLALRADGVLQARWTTASQSNEWALAALSPGLHELELQADEPCEVYVSHCTPQTGGGHVERTVCVLAGEPLRYRVVKQTAGREQISFRLFTPGVADAGHVVDVSVNGNVRQNAGPVDSWTFASTKFRLRPSEKVTGRLLGTDPGVLSGGELFQLTLGADLEPGTHEITVTLEEGPSGYLQAAHLVPGRRDERAFFAEPTMQGSRAASLPTEE